MTSAYILFALLCLLFLACIGFGCWCRRQVKKMPADELAAVLAQMDEDKPCAP